MTVEIQYVILRIQLFPREEYSRVRTVRIEDRIKVGGLLTAPSVSIALITLVHKVGAALLIVGLALSWLQSATANEKPGGVDGRKAELEVQKARLEVRKLQLEVAQLKREHRWWFSGPLGLAAGLATGAITTAATIWVARLARRGGRDQAVHEKRLEFYPLLVKAASPLALYFPDENPIGKASIEPNDCRAMGRAMSQWYFDGGGLLLSKNARDAYFKLARALTLASLAPTLEVPTFPDDAKNISFDKVRSYQKELQEKKLDLADVEKWKFESPASDKEAPASEPHLEFKDYVFLQRLSSDLRTKLTEDLESRLRPL